MVQIRKNCGLFEISKIKKGGVVEVIISNFLLFDEIYFYFVKGMRTIQFENRRNITSRFPFFFWIFKIWPKVLSFTTNICSSSKYIFQYKDTHTFWFNFIAFHPVCFFLSKVSIVEMYKCHAHVFYDTFPTLSCFLVLQRSIFLKMSRAKKARKTPCWPVLFHHYFFKFSIAHKGTRFLIQGEIELYGSTAEMSDKVRIVVAGDTGVGKTCFLNLLCHGQVLKKSSWTVGCNLEVYVSNLK